MHKRYRVALVGAGALLAASVAALAATPPNPSQIPTTGEHPKGAPQTVKRSWGTFKLSSKIAAKVKSHQAINYVFSYQASGIPLFSQQYQLGYKRGCTDGSKIYPLSCASIAPSTKSTRECTIDCG